MKLWHMKHFIRLVAEAALILSLAACKGNISNTGGNGSAQTQDTDVWQASEDEMKAAVQNASAGELMLGLWVTPRSHMMSTQEVDARFAEIREAGIQMVYTHGEINDTDWLTRMLTAAEHNQINVMVELRLVSGYSTLRTNLRLVESTMQYDSVLGYCMYDEPGGSLFTLLGKQFRQVKELVGDTKLVMCNLLPNYAIDGQLGVNALEGTSLYQSYFKGIYGYGRLRCAFF